MKYKAWYDLIKKHLEKYKIEELGISSNGLYRQKEYAHILPNGDYIKNYLCDDYNKLDYKRHQYWHHLNSSQTMCINYFAPLLKDNFKYLNEFLKCYVGRNDIVIKEAEFEHKILAQRESTNFDFECGSTNQKYYFEIKYTEDGIAQKSSAKDAEETFNLIYRKMLENSSYLQFCLKGEQWKKFMYEHYQVYRNIGMANEPNRIYTFFITMAGNENTKKELDSAIKDIGGVLNNVKCIYWEDLITDTINFFKEKNDQYMIDYYKEFKRKYLLD